MSIMSKFLQILKENILKIEGKVDYSKALNSKGIFPTDPGQREVSAQWTSDALRHEPLFKIQCNDITEIKEK